MTIAGWCERPYLAPSPMAPGFGVYVANEGRQSTVQINKNPPEAGF